MSHTLERLLARLDRAPRPEHEIKGDFLRSAIDHASDYGLIVMSESKGGRVYHITVPGRTKLGC
jgi:hypothetical protein